MKMTQDDATLLDLFRSENSQSAFAELVRRHIDFVYASALRQVFGDSGLASDITQTVFIELARKSPRISKKIPIAGWLHHATRLESLAALRAQQRRFHREKEAVLMQENDRSPDEIEWNSISGMIDSCLDGLKEQDRAVVLLRFFKKEDFRQIGETLGISTDAARMRLDRSLDKLKNALAKRGIDSSVAAISIALSGYTTTAAPIGLLSSISSAAAVAAAPSILTTTIIMASKLKTGLAVVAAIGVCVIATREHLSKNALQEELVQLKKVLRTAPTSPAPRQVDSPSLTDRSELNRQQGEHAELMRLRGEVSALRKAKQDAETNLAEMRRKEQSKPEEHIDIEAEVTRNLGLARMNFTQGWGIAAMLFADKHDGLMPNSFEEAADYYPKEWASAMSAFDSTKFEIVYSGVLADIKQPARTIIVREKSSFSNPTQPGFQRTYLFADGHTEIHSSVDGNFVDWERDKLIPSPDNAAGSR